MHLFQTVRLPHATNAPILQVARMEFGLLPGIASSVPCISHIYIYKYVYIYMPIPRSHSRKTHTQSTGTHIAVVHIQRLGYTPSHQFLRIQMCTPVSARSTLAIAYVLVPADFHPLTTAMNNSLMQHCENVPKEMHASSWSNGASKKQSDRPLNSKIL
jgi:hypothetical protein